MDVYIYILYFDLYYNTKYVYMCVYIYVIGLYLHHGEK